MCVRHRCRVGEVDDGDDGSLLGEELGDSETDATSPTGDHLQHSQHTVTPRPKSQTIMKQRNRASRVMRRKRTRKTKMSLKHSESEQGEKRVENQTIESDYHQMQLVLTASLP